MKNELRQILQAIDELATRQAAHMDETRRQNETISRQLDELTLRSDRLELAIAANAKAIAANADGIDANAEGIAANAEGIAANAKAIAANADGIAANAEGIAANAKAIAANADGIDANAEGIAANAKAIATNTAEIRKAHVLVEDNRSAIELVAEGVSAANQRIDSLKMEMNQRFDSQESFFRSALGHLATSHGGRLDRLERHVGLN